MKLNILFIYSSIVFLRGQLCYGAGSNYTLPFEMVSRCKEHICNHGYKYETFYRIDNNDRRTVTNDPSVRFEMHIAILSPSNGHILLSPVAEPGPRQPVYEIVVGGGSNKFTELRRNLQKNGKRSASTPQVLSSLEFRMFFIRITDDGEVTFWREGSELPILTFLDSDPLQVKYFSFAAWSGVDAKFLYDCPALGSKLTDPTSNSKIVERKLSKFEQLKNTLLSDRPPNLPPSPEVTIHVGLKITSVRYNAYDSKLTTGLAFVVSWTDNSIAWDPSKNNDITHLKFTQGQIWTPTFYVYNSDTNEELYSKDSENIMMVSSGEATYHFRTTVNTWCHDYSEGYSRWPRDEYNCTILIHPWQAHEKMMIESLDLDGDKMRKYAGDDDMVQNDWAVTFEHFIVSQSTWTDFLSISNDNVTYQSDKMIILFQLSRRGNAYNVVFYTPLLVLVTFVLLSFWTEPLQMSRIWFYVGCVIIISIGLCYVDYLVPCQKIPSVLVLYITIMMGILVALLIQVILISSVTDKICKSHMMQNLLTMKIVRTVYCLAPMKTCRNYDTINEGFSQEDADSGVDFAPRNSVVEEMQADNKAFNEKEEVAEIVDKTLFFVYSVVIAVMLGCHY